MSHMHTMTVFEPLPLARTLRAYLAEVRYELAGSLRTPGFAIPFLGIPVVIYLVFGVLIFSNSPESPEYGAAIADFLFVSFGVLAVIMPGIFGGVALATEREGKLLKLKRAMPAPPGATIIAKVLMAVTVGAIALALVAIAALVAGKITITPQQLLIICLVLVAGSVPFATIGLLLGTLVSGSSAPAFGNVVFLPMLWFSGLLIPLPDFLERWVVIWPTFHLHQAAMGAAGVEQFMFIPPSMAVAALLGLTVLCGGVAIRRLAHVG